MPTKTKSMAVNASPAPLAAKPLSKSVLVLKLLGRSKGATIEEMGEPTRWQPHSTRAFLSGLRKKGMTIAREPRKSGGIAYRIITTSEAAGAPGAPDVAAGAMAQAEVDAGKPVVGTQRAGADATTTAVAGTTEAAA